MNMCDVTLVMIVAPAAMGKSTIMREVCRQDARFSEVQTFTTRAPRVDDDMQRYIYLTADELAAKHAAGDVVTDIINPSNNQHYGVLTSSFRSSLCLLDTLSNSVEIYQNLPFKTTATISLTSPSEYWRDWFRARHPALDEVARGRLHEAKLSMNWSLDQPDMRWLINDASPETVATRLIELIDDPTASDDGEPLARANLAQIDQIYRVHQE